MITVPLLLIGGAAAALAALFFGGERPVPVHEPDLPPDAPAPSGAPRSTRYKRVDAIFGELRKASASSGVPLGLLVGWIARESNGKLADTTRHGERGYFQLSPDESRSLGLDHNRLSTDSRYSINGGLALIGKYMGEADVLDVAKKGTSYYWRLVKLLHTMGSGAVGKIVRLAKEAGSASTWETLERWALSHEEETKRETKHSPAKWFPLVDKVFEVGRVFGFGTDALADVVLGASYPKRPPAFTDIPDPLDALKPLR